MAKICAACGLTTDGSGRLVVNTAGAWPYAGTPASNGHGIYCDPLNGKIYAEPGTSGPIVFTSSGVLNLAQIGNAKSLKLRVQNGGGSGGTAMPNGAGASSGGGGAAGGSYAERTLPVAGLIFPLQINVGVGGAGTFSDGTVAGTQSSVIDNNGTGSTLCTPGTPSLTAVGHAGPSGTTPGGCGVGSFNSGATGGIYDLLINGGPGLNAARYSATMTLGGAGGDAALGGGGNSQSFTGGSGQNAQGWGGGGAGSSSHPSQGSYLSGQGGGGVVIVELQY